MRLTHLGHACLFVETSTTRLLVDPGRFSHGFEELTDLDAILITHQHFDHVDGERLPALLDANDGARLIAEPEVAAELNHVGLDVEPLHPGQQLAVAGVTVTAVGGRHALVHPDIPLVGNTGFMVTAPGEPTLFHPGDAYAYTPDGVDVLAVPVAGPWAVLRETVEFVRSVKASVAVPIHDAPLSAIGRELSLRILGQLTPEATQWRDLAGAGAVDI